VYVSGLIVVMWYHVVVVIFGFASSCRVID